MTTEPENMELMPAEAPQRPPLDVSTKESRDAVVSDMANMISMVEDAKARILQPSIHYGFIPGTQRPSLWQPGAEILCQMFQWQTRMECTSDFQNWDNGIFAWTYKCVLSNRHGDLITEREATCSTQEPNYQRQIDKGLPVAQFRETVILMAQKRAYVAAVRAAGACSAIFTQDDAIVPDQKPKPVQKKVAGAVTPEAPNGNRWKVGEGEWQYPTAKAANEANKDDFNAFVFPSGKHAGKTLINTPEDYLDWILTKENDPTFRYPEWITAVKAYRSK